MAFRYKNYHLISSSTQRSIKRHNMVSIPKTPHRATNRPSNSQCPEVSKHYQLILSRWICYAVNTTVQFSYHYVTIKITPANFAAIYAKTITFIDQIIPLVWNHHFTFKFVKSKNKNDRSTIRVDCQCRHDAKSRKNLKHKLDELTNYSTIFASPINKLHAIQELAQTQQ